MKRGEGSNQHLPESEVLDVMQNEPNTPNDQDIVLTPSPNAMVVPFPSFPPSNNVSAAASDAGPSNGPGKRRATLGIEFMGILDNGEAKSLAISVISSGENVDEDRNPAAIEFTGYGGTAQYGDGPSDQTMDGMNLALANAINKFSVVRVVIAREELIW
ncbi:hypothetical protein AALP_AAs58757U000100 [Arabis alpina]|uniref:YDG domain-containing protein n=1 Tax=Arabis alpina TaxID=50452 RepID=A0A087FWJ0_ARAAL|nr:hypothetical protein AALP_AAs58757U000100 [Arabis alpina]